MLKRVVMVGLVVTVATAVGCADPKEAAKKELERKTRDLGQLSDETLTRTVSVNVTGDRTVDYKAQTKMRFVLRPGSGEAADFSVASVTFPDSILLDGGWYMMPEVGVTGTYTGDGDYRIPAGVGQAPQTGPRAPSVSGAAGVSVGQVTFFRLEPPADIRYGYVLEPCDVVLRAKATEGSATCPALVNIDGGRVSLTFTWGP